MEFPIYVESGFRGRKAAYIKNPDKHTDAYPVDYRGAADMTIRRGGKQGPTVGRVDFHHFTTAIDISFENNQRVEMRKDGFFSKTRVVDLPAAPNSKRFSWKPTTSVGPVLLGGIKLVDSSGQELALFARSRGASKAGTMTIVASGLEQQFLDQIFVSFMAVEEQMRRQRRAAAGAAGGAAGGGAC